MSTYTPGPWVVRRDEWEGFCVHAPTIESQITGLYRVVRHVNGDETPNPTYGTPEANARLIAAAPELLKALECVRDGMEASGGWPGDEDVWTAVIEAIAKATGEQA